MTVIVKDKPGLTVPEATLKEAGFRPGDLVEFSVTNCAVTIRAASQENRRRIYTPTKAEAAAIRKGRAAYNRGEYVTLKQLHHELDSARHQSGKKRARKTS